MSDFTDAYAVGLNAKREVLGPAGNLKLKTFGASQGTDSVVAEVTGGWGVTVGRGQVVVEIVESAPLAGGGTLTATHVRTAPILEIAGAEYLRKPESEGGIVPPIREPMLWELSATVLGAQR